MHADLPIDGMTDTEFEEFCFELLKEVGFVNLDWRKGTGLNASPSDSGRDIVAQLRKHEVDGHEYYETWFVDCKHYKRGVPPDKIMGLLSWAAAERADAALIIASNFLSNPCKDFLKSYEQQNRPPFRVRYWERPTIVGMLEGREDFINRYLRSRMRTEAELIAAEQEFFDRVWYGRSTTRTPEELRAEGRPEDIIQRMLAARRAVEERYKHSELLVDSEFEWGFVSGKLSALRWILGDEWDNLDT